MRNSNTFIALTAILGFTNLCSASGLQACYNTALTQGEINHCSQQHYQQLHQDMELLYRKILEQYARQGEFITQFKRTQAAWESFRDAALLARYPKQEPGYYGDSFPTCSTQFLAQLTQQRIQQLRVWIDGVVAGDLCAGSVRMYRDY